MRTIIAGSRNVDLFSEARIYPHLDILKPCISLVISGGAEGVDKMGERWAKENRIDIIQMIPDWKKYGHGAGIKRNCEMAADADQLIAFWDGVSSGTAHMIQEAMRQKLVTHVYYI